MINSLHRYIQAIKSIKNYKLKLILSLLNAFILIILTISLQYISIIRFDETAFFRVFSIVKHNVLHIDKKPLRDSIIFIDVSKDLEIIEDTSITSYGDIVITNRNRLAELFSIINQHPDGYRYIVCDMSFDYPSPHDPALRRQIEKAKNLITAATIKNGRAMPQLFRVPYASTDYTLNKGSFVKINIFDYDTIKTLPVKLLENTGSDIFTKKYGLTFRNNRFTFNSIIPEFYYRPNDLKKSASFDETMKSEKQNLFYLGEILTDTTGFFDHYLRNKFIIIGNFTSDMHTTYLGPMPGSLILFDIFLTLREKPISVSAAWVMLLFAVFFCTSYMIFIHRESRLKQIKEKVKIPVLGFLLKKYISYLGILVLINLLSYIFFGILISLFYLATYLVIVEFIIEKRRRFIKSRNLVTFIKGELT